MQILIVDDDASVRASQRPRLRGGGGDAMSACKACGEEIRWVQTRLGKYLPVDADSYEQHTLAPGVVVVMESGEVLRGGEDGTGKVYGYTPHWATCPHDVR